MNDYRERKIFCKIVPIAFEVSARDTISFGVITVLKQKSVFSTKRVAAVLFINAFSSVPH